MKIKGIVKALVGVGLIAHLSACGTLLYPERKGQTDGRIDPGVAAMNGVGLLLFVIPGLVAFAVDFHNGTIYLPNSGAVDGEDEGVYALRNEGPLTYQQAQKMIEQHTGKTIDMRTAEQKTLRAMNTKAIAEQLKQAQQTAN